MAAPTLSLIVPLYNEEANLSTLVAVCERVLNSMGCEWEMILVDDGSTDGSWAVLQRLQEAQPRLKLLRHSSRQGKTAAYRTGFRAAQGDFLFTLDADLQEDPAVMPQMLQSLQEGVDMIVGWRRARRDSWQRRFASWLFNAFLRVAFRVPLHDINCGFRGMRREVAEALLPWLQYEFHRYLPLIAMRLGYTVAEMVVAHRPRQHGTSRYGWERYYHALIDLWRLWRQLRQFTSKG